MAPFVEADIGLISPEYEVSPFEYKSKMDIPHLARSIRGAYASFSWFALSHAWITVHLSKLLRVPSVVVVGGWDVAAIPEIPYGAMLASRSRRRVGWTLSAADEVIVASEASKREALQWMDRKATVVPLAVATGFFLPGEAKQNSVMTVAGISHEQVIKTKGIDIFLEVARRLPKTPFELIGVESPEWMVRLGEVAPDNVKISPWIGRSALLAKFQKHKVYVQLSAHEAFGLALAEAMACGCNAVVSDRGSLPEIVGRVGRVVSYGDIDSTTAAVAKALEEPGSDGGRKRVIEAFSIQRRKEHLLRILRELR